MGRPVRRLRNIIEAANGIGLLSCGHRVPVARYATRARCDQCPLKYPNCLNCGMGAVYGHQDGKCLFQPTQYRCHDFTP